MKNVPMEAVNFEVLPVMYTIIKQTNVIKYMKKKTITCCYYHSDMYNDTRILPVPIYKKKNTLHVVKYKTISET